MNLAWKMATPRMVNSRLRRTYCTRGLYTYTISRLGDIYSKNEHRLSSSSEMDTTPSLWKMATSRIWNRLNYGLITTYSGLSTCTLSHRPFSGGITANESRRGKSVYWKVSNIDEIGGTVADILDREEGLGKADLLRWADLLDKKGKTQQAFEIFEWMQRKKMTFSPSENVTFVDLLAKTKGLRAAQDFVNGLPKKKENLPATFKFLEYYGPFVREELKNSPWSYIPKGEPVNK